jgi:hypothetical protein
MVVQLVDPLIRARLLPDRRNPSDRRFVKGFLLARFSTRLMAAHRKWIAIDARDETRSFNLERLYPMSDPEGHTAAMLPPDPFAGA